MVELLDIIERAAITSERKAVMPVDQLHILVLIHMPGVDTEPIDIAFEGNTQAHDDEVYGTVNTLRATASRNFPAELRKWVTRLSPSNRSPTRHCP